MKFGLKNWFRTLKIPNFWKLCIKKSYKISISLEYGYWDIQIYSIFTFLKQISSEKMILQRKPLIMRSCRILAIILGISRKMGRLRDSISTDGFIIEKKGHVISPEMIFRESPWPCVKYTIFEKYIVSLSL